MIFKKVLHKQGGFTLLEIMVVLAIIGVLAAVAIPTYLSWLPNYRHKSVIRDLQSNFQMAKLEAAKRGTNPAAVVTIEFTTGAYIPAGRIGGYVVFVDADNDRSYNPAVIGEILINRVVMPTNVSLTGATFTHNANFTTDPTGNPAIFFNSRGLPDPSTFVGGVGIVTTRNSLDVEGVLTLNLSGRGVLSRRTSTDGGATWSAFTQWE